MIKLLRKFTILFSLIFLYHISNAQHTFSIVAVDPTTGEIGSAGATCLDSVLTNGFDAYGISGILPNMGAINAQALLQFANLNNGMDQISMGQNAQDVLQWLIDNDVNNMPQDRQYGIVTFDGTNVSAAGFTGDNALDYKNHIVGPNYAIQGNILIGPEILENMENNFLNCTGSLSDKLMYAMQGAKIPGADARCLNEGVSSQSSFLRVAQPTDDPNDLWLDLRVASRPMGMDPIDSLQTLFDVWKAANDPDVNDVGAIAVMNPVSSGSLSATENLTIEIQNFGTADQATYEVGYIFNGQAPVIESVNTNITSGTSSTHTFTSNLDLSAFGDYSLKVFAITANDELNCNDTLDMVVSHYAQLNAGLDNIQGLENNACGNSFPITVDLINFGEQELTTADIAVMLNGTVIENITWNDTLQLNDVTPVAVNIVGAMEGSNELTLEVSSPNGGADQINSNNIITIPFEYSNDNDYVAFNLTTDFYSEETTWQITNANNEIVASGGGYFIPFGDFAENLCLPTNSCYTFTIFDAFGDGICCSYGQGSYALVDETGVSIVSGGQFGAQEDTEFCLETVGVEEFDEKTEFKIFPNPTQDFAVLEIKSQASLGKLEISLFDALGRRVQTTIHEARSNYFKENISLENLPQGTYQCKVSDGKSIQTLIIVKL